MVQAREAERRAYDEDSVVEGWGSWDEEGSSGQCFYWAWESWDLRSTDGEVGDC